MIEIAINTLGITDSAAGARTYLTQIVRSMLAIAPHNRYRILCSRFNASSFAFAEAHPSSQVDILDMLSPGPLTRILYDQLVVPWRLRSRPDTVLVTPSSVASLLARNPQVTIVQAPLSVRVIRRQVPRERRTIGWSQTLYFDSLMPLTMRVSDEVVAVSEHLASALFEQFGRTVDVSHEGVEFGSPGTNGHAVASASSVPYVLFVSTLFPYKNADRMLDAFARLCARPGTPPALRLKVAGRDPDGMQLDRLRAHARSLGVAERVDFLGLVPHSDVWALYSEAEMFVYPSEMETFGLPLLEAMRVGVPVVAARRMSIPEVVGDAGVLFDPDDLDEMTAAMAAVLDDAPLRERLVTRGRERSEQFTWDRAAASLLDVIHRAAERK
ncbi:MAG TPA: glycosyltransferase family 1 protein [Longimicrobiales bacterium]|nr:glycosyltransferase family 1 protein [Longimicrobiales bacterium]